MKIVSVILARGGSKGIPNKNIIDVNGKPLLWYSINASLNSNISETWVSTDSKRIAIVAQGYGAKVLDRPKELATDISQSDDSLIHFANNVDFDILVFIQPTSPLLGSEYINKGLEMMDTYDSVFSAYKEHWVPRWTLDSIPVEWDINNRPRRQDKKELYVENGAFYISTRDRILDSKLRYSGNIGIVEMQQQHSFQIDTTNDLKLVSKLL
jgi:N-acylneuraminate cytidylyltransferase